MAIAPAKGAARRRKKGGPANPADALGLAGPVRVGRLEVVVDVFGGLGDVVECADLAFVEQCDDGELSAIQCGAALFAQGVQAPQRLV